MGRGRALPARGREGDRAIAISAATPGGTKTNGCRLELPVDADFLPVLGSFVDSLAQCYGLSAEARPGFCQSIVDLAKLIIERAFAPGDQASIDVSVVPIGAGLEIIIADRGLPLDPERWTQGGAVEVIQAVRRNMDQVRFVNLGPDGRETRLTKYFQRYRLEDQVGGQEAPPSSDAALEVRRMLPGEGVHVSRCVYRCYGHSYGAQEAIYFPERLEALCQREDIVSVVAITTQEPIEMVGHISLERSSPGSKLGVVGVAAVLPAFRSRGLAQQLTTRLIDEARRAGIEELQAYAVTSHPYSQKLALAFGFSSIGVYLATAYFNFKGMSADSGQRETLIGFYHRLQGSASGREKLYCPLRHRVIVESLCCHIQRSVEFLEPPPENEIPVRPEKGELVVRESPVRNLAKIHLIRYDSNSLDEVRSQVRYLRLHNYRQLVLTLPLCEPMTAYATAKLEKLGFFFAGVQIRDEGLCLALQYLHGVTLDYTKIQAVEPMARELLSYVRVQDPGKI